MKIVIENLKNKCFLNLKKTLKKIQKKQKSI